MQCGGLELENYEIAQLLDRNKGLEPVEFFHDVNIDFLGKKWYFLAFSLVFSVAGVLSMLFWHGIPWGVDFRGGTLVYVKFSHAPSDNAIRDAMDRAGLHNAKIQRYGQSPNHEVLIALAVPDPTA